MAKKKPTKAELTDQSMALAQAAGLILVAAEQSGIKKLVVEGISLDDSERAFTAKLPGLSATLKKKVLKQDAKFTVSDTANMLLGLAEILVEGGPAQQPQVLMLADKLMTGLKATIVPAKTSTAKPKKAKATQSIYQFKITLLGIKPAIWRRIQIQDCTLDNLHEHIQTAMGWTNSHLHQFEIKGQRYGDRELLDDGFDDFEGIDSTQTLLSDILPKTGKKFAFKYEYDFGDSWEHEVLFEGQPPADPKAKYPQCVEGERACPPEDCGGIWGYDELLKAIRNPKHPDHKNMLEWLGGRFNPEKFDAKAATKAMKKGLPDWR